MKNQWITNWLQMKIYHNSKLCDEKSLKSIECDLHKKNKTKQNDKRKTIKHNFLLLMFFKDVYGELLILVHKSNIPKASSNTST